MNMLLSEIMKNTGAKLLFGEKDVDISALVYDSRKITKGCVFVCIKGEKFDGHDAAVEAVREGAAAVVVQKEVEG